MAKDLVIVESPTKARTLTRILGGEYNIRASMGHVRDLPEKDLGIDIENGFKPVYETTPDRKKVIAELKQLGKEASRIVLATDPDREGEAIAWHLRELLGGERSRKQFQRVTFHEITNHAVTEAFQHPGELDMNVVNAQQARRVLDRLVGYQVSPLLWRRIENATSAGRVQSVALRLICEREEEVLHFVPREYWNLTGQFRPAEQPAKVFAAKLFRLDGEKAEVSSATQAEELARAAEAARYQVLEVSRTPKSRRASPPFITSTLQQAASSNLGMSPEQTMRVAQELYEGVDTGSGPVGLITYMRTDSVNIAKEAQQRAREFISAHFGADFVPERPNVYRSGGAAQEAHEAIRPTDVQLTPERAAKYLDPRQAKLYELIWKRFVACQMAPARLQQYSVDLGNSEPSQGHRFVFRATTTSVLFPGYMRVYNLHDTEDEADDESNAVPDLREHEACGLVKLEREQKFTEPPPRFSEAMLVRELERNGVGRPSTYASIVRTIKDRDYVLKEKGKLRPTDLGRNVNQFLVSRMPTLFEVGFTARMEGELDDIESGKLEWEAMIGRFYEKLTAWIEEARSGKVPEMDVVRRVLTAFPAEIRWEEPETIGKRKYDHGKFYTSLQQQVEEARKLTNRQWEALIALAVRYRAQLPGIAALAAELGFAEAFRERVDKIEARANNSPEANPEAAKLLEALAGVTDWKVDTRGKRTYDDGEFFRSLKQQVEQGRNLSDRQLAALRKLAAKYSAQIPGYAQLQESVALPEPPSGADKAQTEALLALVGEIKQWDAPGGGRARFDDEKFAKSLADQYQRKGSLSDKQVAVLKRLAGKYSSQIADFATRAAALGLEAGKGGGGAARAPRPEPEDTGILCPECKTGKIMKRNYRGRTFFGCNGYPQCRYAVSSLDRIPKAE